MKMMHKALVKSKPCDSGSVTCLMHAMLLRTQKKQTKRLLEVVWYLGAEECQNALLQRHLGDKVAEGGNCRHLEFYINGIYQ